MLPKASTYVKRYDGQTKLMYFFIQDDELLEKCNTIWDKVSADIKKEFHSEPVYNKEFLKTETKSHGDEVICFYDEKSSQGGLLSNLLRSNYLEFCSQERWQLLLASAFKRV